MAKRKAWQRALGGLGEGIGNASQLLLRQQMQDRYDTKIANRQTEAANRQFIEELDQAVAEGKIEPSQAQQMAQTRGIKLPATFLEAVRPTVRKRLGSALDKPIMEAKSPEEVPSVMDIQSVGKAQGAFLPDAFMVSEAQTDDPLAGASPEVGEFAQRAETRRKSLMAKPTERAEVTDPLSGAKSLQFVSPYAGPIQTAPSAEQEGALAGRKEVATTDIAGPSRTAQAAGQAGATRQATLNVENQPVNVSGSAKRAAAIAGAESNARFPNELKIAQERAKAELEMAVNKENALNLVESTRAAQQLRPFFDKLHALSLKINTGEGVVGRATGLVRAGQAAIGNDPDVVQLQQLIAQNLRPLAILAGVREANVSNTETQQALQGLGIKTWTTHTEAVNALRNLDDLIDLAPIVAVRANTYAGIGERIQMASDLIQQRRAAEARAIKLNSDTYIDPIKLTPRKVIK